jgi:hypothetical protein
MLPEVSMHKLIHFNYYKILSLATALLFVFLSIQLLFMTDSFISDLGLQSSEATSVLGRRAAMFMLGIAVLMFGSRNFLQSEARQLICLSTGVSLFGLSLVGLFEYFRGTVNSSIFVAIGIETVLWVAFGLLYLKGKRSI